MKKAHEVAKQVMEMFIADKLNETLAKAPTEELRQTVTEIVEGLVLVQARLTTSYLMSCVQETQGPEDIALIADKMSATVGEMFDEALTIELARVVEIMQEMVEDMQNSGSQTSH